MTNTNSTDPRTLVRTASPDPAPINPKAGGRERRERVNSADAAPPTINPIAGGRERRERVQTPNPEAAPPSVNRERRERVPTPNPSTGPKTQAGKSQSSKNAITHGLRAKKLENAVPPILQAAYEKLRQQYLHDYKPTGAIESTLLDMVIFAAWQLYKVREMELFTDIDIGVPGSFGRSEKLARYRGSHERLFFRSLNQLRQIQQERLLRETDQKAALPAQIPPAVRPKPLFAHPKTLQRHPKTKTAASTLPKPGVSGQREWTPSQNLRP